MCITLRTNIQYQNTMISSAYYITPSFPLPTFGLHNRTIRQMLAKSSVLDISWLSMNSLSIGFVPLFVHNSAIFSSLWLYFLPLYARTSISLTLDSIDSSSRLFSSFHATHFSLCPVSLPNLFKTSFASNCK